MVRVLIDGVIYGRQRFGGISRCFTETLNRLGNHCDDIRVLLHLPGQCQARIPKTKWIHEIKDWDLRPRRIFGRISRAVSKARIMALGPKVFHSTYYTFPYWSGIKSVVTVHDFLDERFPALAGNEPSFPTRKRNVIENADAIVAVSNSTKNDILEFTKADESRIIVIHHGCNEAFFRDSSSEENIRTFQEINKIRNPYWLYVGNRGLYKNFGTFLRAFIRVALKINGYIVAVGGEYSLEAWELDLLVKNRLEQKVIRLNAIDDDDLRVIYSGASALVFPSLGEGFGIPLLEAMACGTPIVASDIPVFREIAADTVLYFDSHDEEALADAMIKVLDESLRQDLVKKGRNRVRAFSWESAAKKLSDVYKRLV